jgi:hypothetical protein
VLASLSGATNEVLSDWIGWGLPIFVVALIAIVLAPRPRWSCPPPRR